MLCSCSYESQMIDGGNAVIERIDSYKDYPLVELKS